MKKFHLRKLEYETKNKLTTKKNGNFGTFYFKGKTKTINFWKCGSSNLYYLLHNFLINLFIKYPLLQVISALVQKKKKKIENEIQNKYVCKFYEWYICRNIYIYVSKINLKVLNHFALLN